MEEDIYTRLVNENKSNELKGKESQEWYREKALLVKKKDISTVEVMEDREKSPKLTNKKFIGRLFMYLYMPKTKMQLPYYDMYPIVFPMSFTKTGFTGLNLHYLPPDLRALFMDNLYVFSNSNDYTRDNTRLMKLSYERLTSSKKFKYFHPCIKTYNHKQIRSRIAYIPPSEWELALFLPLQQFKKKSQTVVWAKSRKIIREKSKAE